MTQQIFQAVEAIKLAYLSHTPVVWLVTGDKEVASEVAEEFVKEHYGSFRSSEPPVTVNLETFEGHIKDRTKPTISYKWLGNDDEQSLKTLNEAIEDFVTYYLHLQAGEVGVQGMEDHHIDGIKKSLVIIASPTLPKESWLNRYIEFIYVSPLSDDEIEKIVCRALTEKGISVSEQRRISQLVVNLRGFSARQISQTIQRCIIAGFFDFNQIEWKRVFNEVRKMKRQMLEGFRGLKWIDVKDNEQSSSKTTDNSSLDVISSWMDERCGIFEDTEKAQEQGYDIPKGVLITGIPGTGKSMMAKITAQKLGLLGLPLISLDMGDLQEGLVGASEQHMVDALRMVEAMAPCVLWIDEIEKAFSGSNSGSSDGGVMRRMFGKFLTWMQEKTAPCFVFATSNDISQLPPELFRSERFDEKFYSFMPMVDECASIFCSLVRGENEKFQSNNPDDECGCLFSIELTKPEVWKSFLNSYSRNVSMDMDGNKWKGGKVPQCKLFTGADISMVVKLTKFKLLKQFKGTASNFQKELVFNTVKDVLADFMPYGQTNLKDIANCFVLLSRNRFKSASSSSVINFDDYNVEKSEMNYNADCYADDYDKALYAAVVGAINFYASKKNE